MAWLQVKVYVDIDKVDEITDLLLTIGAQAITCEDAADQPLYEPPLGTTPWWNQTLIIGLFDENQVNDPLLDYIKSQVNIYNIHTEPLIEKDWQAIHQADVQPRCFGQRLWICPSWAIPPDPHAINIVLDPGLAFGTGSHPTTALCLEWLAGQSLQDLSLIDYGCGSGILAVAAVKLGAKLAVAIDHDPQALLATHDNGLHNHISEQELILASPEEMPTICADRLVANILANPLIELAARFAELVKINGQIALSGILQEQANQVMQAFEKWFCLQAPIEQEGWVLLTGVRK